MAILIRKMLMIFNTIIDTSFAESFKTLCNQIFENY